MMKLFGWLILMNVAFVNLGLLPMSVEFMIFMSILLLLFLVIFLFKSVVVCYFFNKMNYIYFFILNLIYVNLFLLEALMDFMDLLFSSRAQLILLSFKRKHFLSLKWAIRLNRLSIFRCFLNNLLYHFFHVFLLIELKNYQNMSNNGFLASVDLVDVLFMKFYLLQDYDK